MRTTMILSAAILAIVATCVVTASPHRAVAVDVPTRLPVEPGPPKLIPMVGDGAPFAEGDPKLAWKGTSIRIDSQVDGDELFWQSCITNMINITDTSNEARFERFRWCLDQDNLKLVGWWGIIKEITPKREGGVIVKIRVSPELVSTWGAITFTGDYIWEEYFFDGFNLVYLRSIESEKALTGSIQTF